MVQKVKKDRRKCLQDLNILFPDQRLEEKIYMDSHKQTTTSLQAKDHPSQINPHKSIFHKITLSSLHITIPRRKLLALIQHLETTNMHQAKPPKKQSVIREKYGRTKHHDPTNFETKSLKRKRKEKEHTRILHDLT
ncbi:hypothetical protein HS088_TW20G00279 [Tripterygium wilfordii]|uniref:Uncharacterized protein n=1 Tax=Tripterygium wilfordii TaxID=458696 RepID=A0A7J7C721_TRIWF|nr:hypothetical protein HS088_TW20G00279 [Tripterygium wilfordii]